MWVYVKYLKKIYFSYWELSYSPNKVFKSLPFEQITFFFRLHAPQENTRTQKHSCVKRNNISFCYGEASGQNEYKGTKPKNYDRIDAAALPNTLNNSLGAAETFQRHHTGGDRLMQGA